MPEFAACLLPFAFGVLAIVVTSGCTYLSQWFYAGQLNWAKKAGFRLNVICILLGISSYGLFIYGLLISYGAFVAYK